MKKLLLFVFIGSLFVSCSSVKIKSDYDKTVDFNQYKTLEYYGWAQDSDKILNRFDKERIEEAAGKEFKKRGMEFVESGGDLVVALFRCGRGYVRSAVGRGWIPGCSSSRSLQTPCIPP